MTRRTRPSKGEIWIVDLNSTRGHETSGQRRALVISGEDEEQSWSGRIGNGAPRQHRRQENRDTREGAHGRSGANARRIREVRRGAIGIGRPILESHRSRESDDARGGDGECASVAGTLGRAALRPDLLPGVPSPPSSLAAPPPNSLRRPSRSSGRARETRSAHRPGRHRSSRAGWWRTRKSR